MNKLFTKVAKIFLGLSMAAGVGVAIGSGRKDASLVHADEESAYTITFANNAGSATALSSSVTATTTIASASRAFVTSSPYTIDTGNNYYGGDGKNNIRLGKSGSAGGVTIALSNSGKVKATKIVVNCMVMTGSKNTGGTLSVNSMTAQTAPTSAGNLTFTFSNATDITSISLASSKAVFIYSIEVYKYKAPATGYTVSFAVNNDGYGTVSQSSITNVPSSTAITISSNTVTINGTTVTATPTASSNQYTYAFSSWTKSPNNSTVTSDMTITANFTRTTKTYTLTYNSNGGGGTMTDSSSPYAYNTQVTVLSNGFTAPSGKIFDHWDTKADDSGTDYASGAKFNIQTNTTLYAQWVNGYSVSTSVTGYSLSGTSSGVSGAEIDDLYIVPGLRLDYPTEISISGTGVTDEDWDYYAASGLIHIYDLKADMTITFDPVDAEKELCVSGQTTEFEKGTDFSSTGIRVYWLYADSELTEDDISAGGQHGYTIDSTRYNKNKVGTYKIIVSCDGETVEYNVRVVNAPTIDYIDDTLTPSNISNPSTYTAWSGKSKTITGIDSDSIYGGYSTGGTTYIQMRASDSGIYTSTSGGKINKVTVVWNSSTVADRQLKIYGSDSAFTSISSIEESGTYVGQIDHNTSQTEYTFSADYTYVGIRPYGGATYFDSITFQWAVEVAPADPAVSITSTFTALKYAGETGTVTAEYVNESGDEGSMEFESETTSVATIDEYGVVTAVGKGSTLITVSDSEGVATAASFTLRVVSAHKGDRQSDALTTEEAVEIYKIDNDQTTEYYVAGTIKEIDTTSYDDPDYFIDKTSANGGFDFYGPEAGNGIALSTLTVNRQVIAYGTIKEWEANDEPTGTYGMPAPTIVYVNIGTLQSISISGTMTNTSYSSKDSEWDMTGITVTATYQGEANTFDISDSVSWTYNYSSPAAVPLTCDKNDSEQVSLTIGASFGDKTASMASQTTVTITNNGYFVHTATSGWEKTNLSDLTADDTFVIVGIYSGSPYAMSNDNGTSSAPSAVSVTIANNQITSTVAPNLQWNVSGNATDGYVFTPNGSNSSYLYNTATNNGVRVGTPDNAANKVYTVSNGGYLYNANNQRYIGVYSGSDWRSYGNTTGNIANETFEFYKKSGVYEVGDDLIGAVNSFEGEYSWSAQCTSFESSDWASGGECFTSSIKSDYHLNQIVANINGNKIEAFLAKYDVVIGKFGTTHDFLGRFSEGGINYSSARIVPMINIVGSTNTVAIIVIISVVSVSAIGGYFFLRKRREQY